MGGSPAEFGVALRNARGPSVGQLAKLSAKYKKKNVNHAARWINDDRVRHRLAKFHGNEFPSIPALAERMGINKSRLNDYELGRKYPPLEFVFDFRDALGLVPEPLLRKWLRLHPHPLVRKHGIPLTYLRDEFKDGDAIRKYPESQLRSFVTQAIAQGILAINNERFSEEEIVKAASIASTLMNIAFREGIEVSSAGIQRVMNLYEYEVLGLEDPRDRQHIQGEG